MRGRKAALEDNSATTTEHPLRIPPACAVHLAMTGDDEPELEQVVEIKGPTIEGQSVWHRFPPHVV